MDNKFIINGRKIPRSVADMETEYAFIKDRGLLLVFIGRGKNDHEAAPFVEFLRRKGIEVITG